jgi:hypothetical protein
MAANVRRVNGLPNNGQAWATADIDAARFKNQFAIAGGTGLKSPYHDDENASLFLEYVYADGVFNILDKDGVAIYTGVPATLDLSHSPIRIDGGFSLTGATFAVVKGFVIRG